jgi:CheY-like chemotaxis protein
MDPMNVMKTVKILVVEDSPSDVRLIREALREAPMVVHMTVARDGVEATDYLYHCKKAHSALPDVILLDLNLPRKNGREVLMEVKGDPDLKQIPVLVMTSSYDEDDIAQAYSLNANCYIRKPIDLIEYQRVVRAIEDFWFLTVTLPETYGAPLQASVLGPSGHRIH